MTSQIDPTVPVTGTPTTQSVRDNFQTAHDEISALQAATPAPSITPPAMDGTSAVGTGTTYARADHVHPTDTSRYAASNPAGFLTAAQAAPAFNGVGRNLLHNPLFGIAQRGVGPFTTNGAYTLDRWVMQLSVDTVSISQQALTAASMTTVDEAAEKALLNVFSGNASAGSYTIVTQRIEDVRRLSGKSVTVSFWAAASPGTPKLGVSLDQYFGTGGSPSAQVSGNGQATPALSGVWTRYSFTFALPSVSGVTLGTNNDSAIFLNIWYSSGATNATRSGNIGVQSGTIYLWGVQLEIGTAASPLEKPDPRYDLANCQRFYQTGQVAFMGYSNQAAMGCYASANFNTPMRAFPTFTATANNMTNATLASWAPLAGNSGVTAVCDTVGVGPYSINLGFTASADL